MPATVPDVNTTPLPGPAAFDNDAAAHRAWYRTNVVALVLRPDLTATRIAAAAGVSNKSITDWFTDQTGMTPRAYRAHHGLKATCATPPGPDPQTLAAITRLHTDVACTDGRAGDVVMDLRRNTAIVRTPVEQILLTQRSAAKQWTSTVSAHAHTDPEGEHVPHWRLVGYGLGTNVHTGASVLMGTYHDPAPADPTDAQPWRFVIVTDAQSHAKFAMSWCKGVLPGIAEALIMSGGVTSEARHRFTQAQYTAWACLDTLSDALGDPHAWAEPGTRPLRGPVRNWETSTERWHDSVSNCQMLLSWSAAGVSRRHLVGFFERRGWSPDTAMALRDLVGVDDFEEMAAALEGTGEISLLHHVPFYIQAYREDRARR